MSKDTEEFLSDLRSKTPEELQAESDAKMEELTGGAGAAFASGLGRGIAGPLFDMGMSAAGLSRLTKKQREINPMASGAGELLGFAGGALTGTGLGGILTRAGAKTAAKLGSHKAIGKIAGAAVEGAGMGISEGTTKSVLDGELGIPGMAADVAYAGGLGAAIGGAAGIFGTALNKTANWFFKKGFKSELQNMGTMQDGRREAHKLYHETLEQIQKVEAAGGKGSDEWNRLVGNFGKGQETAGYHARYNIKTHVDDWDTTPVEESALLLAKRAMNNADKGVARAAKGALEKVAKEGGEVAKRLGDATIALTMAGGLGGAGFATPLAARWLLPGLSNRIGKHILGVTAKSRTMRRFVSKSLQAGELTYGSTVLQGTMRGGKYHGEFVRKAHRGVEAMGRLIGALKMPPVRAMSNIDFFEITNEINEVDLGQYEMQIRSALASKGVPQELANAHIDSQIAAVQYLKEMSPAIPSSNWITDTGYVPAIPSEERRRFSRRVRAAMAPMSAITDFLDNELTREGADTFRTLHPEMSEQISQMVRSNVEIAALSGRKFSAKEQQQIALITNEPVKMGRTRSPEMIQFLQGNYAQAREEQQAQAGRAAQPSQGSPTGVNNNYLSESQKIMKGIK